MDNTAGISLFQNFDFRQIELNNDLPTVEEIEAAEDEKRLDYELKEMVKNAFDDLEDTNIQSINGDFSSTSSGCCSSIHSSREVEKLKEEIEQMKKNAHFKKVESSKKLMSVEAEKNKFMLSYNESQNVLTDVKGQLSETRKELQNVKNRLVESERIKSNTIHELEMCKETLRESEQRLMIAEKHGFKHEERNYDSLLKEITSKHKREVSKFQKEISNLRDKLNIKENEIKTLTEKYQLLLSDNDAKTKNITDLENMCRSQIEFLECKLKNKYEKELHETEEKYSQELNMLKSDLMSYVTKTDILQQEQSKIQNLKDKYEQLQLDNNSKTKDLADLKITYNNLIENLESKLKNCEKELREKEENHSKESETLKLGLMDYVSKAEMLHEERLKIQNLKDKYEQIQLDNNNSKTKDLADLKMMYSNLIENLEFKLKSYEKELREKEQNHSKELETLKLGLMDYVTKADILHEEQLSTLEFECSKQLLELETTHKEYVNQFEYMIRNQTVTAYTDEINRLEIINKMKFDELNKTIKCCNNDINNKTKHMQLLNEKNEKLHNEINKIYNKYKNMRKTAVSFKQIAEERTKLLKKHREQYVQTLHEIQKYVDEALSGDYESDKLCKIVEKTTNEITNVENLIILDDEIDNAMGNINKKLEYLKKNSVKSS